MVEEKDTTLLNHRFVGLSLCLAILVAIVGLGYVGPSVVNFLLILRYFASTVILFFENLFVLSLGLSRTFILKVPSCYLLHNYFLLGIFFEHEWINVVGVSVLLGVNKIL